MDVTQALPFTYALTHIKRTFQRMLNWSQLIKDLIMDIFGYPAGPLEIFTYM